MMATSKPRSSRSVRSSSIGVNLASMIDVVFLLLIYFMVATDFRPGEQVFRLDLPQRGEGLSITNEIGRGRLLRIDTRQK